MAALGRGQRLGPQPSHRARGVVERSARACDGRDGADQDTCCVSGAGDGLDAVGGLRVSLARCFSRWRDCGSGCGGGVGRRLHAAVCPAALPGRLSLSLQRERIYGHHTGDVLAGGAADAAVGGLRRRGDLLDGVCGGAGGAGEGRAAAPPRRCADGLAAAVDLLLPCISGVPRQPEPQVFPGDRRAAGDADRDGLRPAVAAGHASGECGRARTRAGTQSHAGRRAAAAGGK